MPIIRFTENIQRHVECPLQSVKGCTVREALEHYFASNARARGYVLDDLGHLRKHMVAFVDGQQVRDRQGLSDPVSADSAIDVIQSLSGG